MPETETGTREVQQLRRCIRDLVALSAIPAVCVDYAPPRIAESFADVLRHMLNLDFLYLAVRHGADGDPLEVAYTSQGPAPPNRVQEIRTALDPWLRADPSGRPSTMPDPFGGGTIPIVLYPFWMQARSGFLVASSRRADFPNETDRLLLGVGANQVAILLERRRAEEALRESEGRFRGTFENAAVGILHYDHEGRWLRINQRFCDILGYTPEELLGRTFQELTHPGDLAANLKLFGALMRGELSTYTLEKRYVRKDGSFVWGEVTASLQRDAAGRPAYCIAIVQDVSERKRLEAELREAKEAAEAAGARVTRILESITDAFYALDRDWRFTYINPQAEPLMSRPREEMLGRVVWDEFPEATGSTFERMYREALATGRAVTFEEFYPPLATWFEVRAYPSADGLSVYFRDMTERRRSEEALRLANARLDLTVRGSNITLFELNMPDGVLENGRLELISVGDQIYGYEPSELGTDFAATVARVHPDDRERVLGALRAHLSGQTNEFEAEYRTRHKDGSYSWRLTRGVAVRDAEGRAVRCMASAIDITALKRAEEALRASEQRFRTFVDHATDAFYLQASDGVILDVNRQACQSLGYTRDELIGMTPLDFDPDLTPAMLKEMQRRGDAGEEIAFESRQRRKDGTVFPVEVRGRGFWEGGRRFVVSLARDITDRKRLEAELRQANARLDLAIRGSNVGLWEVDMPDGEYATGVTTWINVWEQLGIEPPADRSPSSVSVDFVHPDDKDRVLGALDAYLRGETKEYEHEYRVRHKDGTYRWMLTRGTAVRDPAGKPIRMLGCRVDITELKRVEEVLRESEAWFRFMANAMPQIVWTAGPDGTPEYLNDRFEEYTGLPLAEVTGERWLSVVHPDDRERTMARWMADLASGSDHDVEWRLRAADGRYRWVKNRGLPVRDGSGRIVKWLGTVTDIDDQKRVEVALRESEAWFRFLANAMPQVVWTARPDGSCDYLNQHCEHYTGVPVAEMLEEGWLSYLHPDDRARTVASWIAAVGRGTDYDVEWRLRSADGAYRWFKTRGLPVRDESGLVVKWVGTSTDIDDQTRAAEALRRAKEAAEAASRAKDEFLANVSHEIRTPMNAILGMTELALDTPLTGEQREYLAIVKSSADALLKVINDLLDFAKIEAGKLELDRADFSLRHVMGETLRALALRAHRKGLELACRIQPEVPDALIGDAGRLRQVLLNLIGNAIKFTEQGEVVVRVEVGAEHTPPAPDPSVPGPSPSPVLHFAISDTGIGIPLEKQEKIFQAFEQGDNSTTRRYEGTGLGLSIAARLVALMGGEITVESDPGRGSTFRFSAGFGSQPAPPSGPHERPLVDLHGLRVLVVDDNATNRQILEEWLRGWRTEPMAVADGFKALEALWSAASVGRPFALVLLDARMPGTDGLAVAASIRQSPVLSTSRIILLTSEDLRGDLARYRELGIAAYAMKPVQQEELLEMIHRVLSRPAADDAAVDPMGLIEAVSTAEAATTSVRRLRVLVAEDNPFNQRLVEHLLGRKGHDIRVASDGLEALAALERGGFDLMLLDVHMPGCDGFQVIEALRQREQAKGGHLPVIALTARAMRSDRDRCLEAGMDDYLAKPIDAAELFRVMDRVLVGRPVSEPEPPARVRPATLLDPAALLAACDDDATLLRELVQVYRADAPGALARVRDAVDRRDATQLREAAHALRGLLSTFSALAAAEADRLETMGAGGQLDAAAAPLDVLAGMVERLGPQLEGLSIEQLRHQAALGRTA